MTVLLSVSIGDGLKGLPVAGRRFWRLIKGVVGVAVVENSDELAIAGDVSFTRPSHTTGLGC